MDNLMLNNKIYLEGKVVSGMEFSHEMYREGRPDGERGFAGERQSDGERA